MAASNGQLWGGIDLGGTNIQAVVVDDVGGVVASAREPTPTTGGPADVVNSMAAALRKAGSAAGVETRALTGVGVGAPGAIDPATGALTGAPNLPGWSGTFPLAAALDKAVGTSVAVGNDVQVATDAEATLGAGRPYGSLLGVFWGTGVGGGIVLDGRPWIGRGAAAEIGHVVVRPDGAVCGCGRRGCMEAYAGRASMERRARKRAEKGERTQLFKIMERRGRTRLTSGVWARALERGDPLAIKLIDEAIEAIGIAVASVNNVLDVDAVIVGGGLGVRLGEPYVRRIEEAMMPHLFVSDRPPAILGAALGDLGGALGAALLAGAGKEG